MGQFNFIETDIPDLYIVEPAVLGDERGYFMESYNERDFFDAGLVMRFIQDNESRSKKGVLRGLHFQMCQPQGKLVRCTEGEVFDVAVDLRSGSPTYGMWKGIHLSSENKLQFYIPEGFAHGFLVLSEFATFNYKCTNFYAPECENGLLWDDKALSISWPVDGIDEIILSNKDCRYKGLEHFVSPFSYRKE